MLKEVIEEILIMKKIAFLLLFFGKTAV